MKIGLYNLVSEAHNEGYINSTLQGFLADIEEKLGEKFENISLEDFNQKEYFPLIFIKSGGVEGRFKQIFKQRVREWADKLDVEIQVLYVRPMSNKWASCSSNGNLNFNSELLAIDREVWDYVIVHELLHFSVPNHGSLWKSLMRAHLGSYEEMEAKLKAQAVASIEPKKYEP